MRTVTGPADQEIPQDVISNWIYFNFLSRCTGRSSCCCLDWVLVSKPLSWLTSQGQTICEKYSTALNLSQMNFMDTVVNQVLEDELANPTIRVFFDGTAPAGSTDFTKSTTNFSTLTGHFTTFFGSALGCNDPAFPKYTGNMDMKVCSEFHLTV